ncbi:MAG TPA: aminodeoxychorismate lyase [Methylococcaceae bacterium]|nr:aminodeoxychorismate lyase [Methylococcaceae bacterium]
MPLIWVDGRESRRISALDRGLHYGDGVFTTLAVRGGAPLLLDRHLARLARDCGRLGIPCPAPELLRGEAARLSRGQDRAVLKITITRGEGGRGYRAPDECRPTRLLALHPWPEFPGDPARDGIAARVCHLRLGRNPALAGIKHLNRLEQVLARSEWDDPKIREGVLLDCDGAVVEGVMSNLFWVKEDRLFTPCLNECGVAGVMRALVLELAGHHGLFAVEVREPVSTLFEADEAFFTNSVIGLWPARSLDGRAFAPGPVSRRVQGWLDDAWCGERP